jgi:hypothetical protein
MIFNRGTKLSARAVVGLVEGMHTPHDIEFDEGRRFFLLMGNIIHGVLVVSLIASVFLFLFVWSNHYG